VEGTLADESQGLKPTMQIFAPGAGARGASESIAWENSAALRQRIRASIPPSLRFRGQAEPGLSPGVITSRILVLA
jgi:hypothetical protein